MTDAACAHSRLEYKPKKYDGGWGARWVCPSCDGAFDLRSLDRLPRLTVTRETSAEVRSVPSVGGCQVIVHPKLGGSGGMQAEIPAEHINRAERLAPGCQLYCYEGVEGRDGRIQRVIVYYAMGSEETFDEARAAMTAGCEVSRA